MSIWRFTGNPENWITAIGRSAWALNENNKGLWENKIKPGDVVIFHSTAKSDFPAKPKSSIIGLGYVGEGMYEKQELWWIQETRDKENHWPYVVPLKEVYLFSDTSDVNFEKDIAQKSEEEVISDIKNLIVKGIPLSALNEKAHEIDSNAPNFPVNGSASGVNEIYEKLIIDEGSDFYTPGMLQDTDEIEKRLSESIDEQISSLSPEEVLEQAKTFKNSEEQYVTTYGKKRVRKENQKQKRLVAKLYDYTCQVCGFRCEYIKKNGQTGYIVEVDHILDKALGGGEEMKNLWVLCPNCHTKKTRGVIELNLDKGEVLENGIKCEVTDKHLFSSFN